MRSWWDRFFDGVGAGFLVTVFAIAIMFASFSCGHQVGWQDGINESARKDGGVYMKVTIGNKSLEGYMR